MRSNESSRRRKLLSVGVFLIAVTLVIRVGITKYSQPPLSDEENAQAYWENQPMVTPSPWTEVARVTSPNGTLDGVLVKGDPDDSKMLCVTSLFLVPRGAKVKDEGSHKLGWSRDRFEKMHNYSPFIAFEATNVSLSWKDSQTLEISGRVSKIFAQAATQEIQVDGEQQDVKLEYRLLGGV